MLPQLGLVYPEQLLTQTKLGNSLASAGEVDLAYSTLLGNCQKFQPDAENKVRDALLNSHIQLLKLQAMENIICLQKKLAAKEVFSDALALPPLPQLDLLPNLVAPSLSSLPLNGLASLSRQNTFGSEVDNTRLTGSQRSESRASLSSILTAPISDLSIPRNSAPAGVKRSYARAFKPRLCSVPGCTTQDKGGGLCAKHGGGKPCAFHGCTKRVAGTRFCSAHGGTRKKRCTFPNCKKGDQGGGFCAAHGGGKRCSLPGCTKRAVGKGLCWSHGGGKRCKIAGCNKSPSSNGLCTMHLKQLEHVAIAQ